MTEASALPLKESKASQNTRGQQKSSITRGKDRFILLHPLKKKALHVLLWDGRFLPSFFYV